MILVSSMSGCTPMRTATPTRKIVIVLLDRFDNASGASLFFGPGGLAFVAGAIVLLGPARPSTTDNHVSLGDR